MKQHVWGNVLFRQKQEEGGREGATLISQAGFCSLSVVFIRWQCQLCAMGRAGYQRVHTVTARCHSAAKWNRGNTHITRTENSHPGPYQGQHNCEALMSRTSTKGLQNRSQHTHTHTSIHQNAEDFTDATFCSCNFSICLNTDALNAVEPTGIKAHRFSELLQFIYQYKKLLRNCQFCKAPIGNHVNC